MSSRRASGGWRGHLTAPNVLSTLAVFAVLAGGTAIAAGLPKNSVTSASVKNGSIVSADLANGKGVTGADVADGSLTGADLGNGAIAGAQLDDGSLGTGKLAPSSIGGIDIGPEAIGPTNVGANAVDSTKIKDGTVTGHDIGTETLTGAQIDEQSLALVPNAERLGGHRATDFLTSSVVPVESPLSTGSPSSGPSFIIEQGCPTTTEVLIAGGPANIDPGTTIDEDGPFFNINKGSVWRVRIQPANNTTDTFSVVAVCVRLRF